MGIKWSNLTKAQQWATGTLAGIAALFLSFATVFDGVAKTTEVVDEMVMTEEEHSHDVQLVLDQLRKEQLRFKAYTIQEKIDTQTEIQQRAIREIDRLDRDLAGGKYNNLDEKEAMLRSLRRNTENVGRSEERIETWEKELKAVEEEMHQ